MLYEPERKIFMAKDRLFVRRRGGHENITLAPYLTLIC
jgi:hypothetical protein